MHESYHLARRCVQQLHDLVLHATWLQPLLDNPDYMCLLRLWQAHAMQCLDALLTTPPDHIRWRLVYTTARQVLMNAPDVQPDMQEHAFICNQYRIWELNVEWMLYCVSRHARDGPTPTF